MDLVRNNTASNYNRANDVCDDYACEALMPPGVVLEPEHEAWPIVVLC